MSLHPVVGNVTGRIAERSRGTRADYLARMDAARLREPARARLGCGNLAHAFAAAGEDKATLRGTRRGNVGIAGPASAC